MGKNKLAKFADMEAFENVLQFPYSRIAAGEDFENRGRWNAVFCNDNPIVLELGCGKGEYTVELAKKNPDKNFIGIDIKGARMWTGAKSALEQKLRNVMFLRCEIEFLSKFFAEDEVSEIWITFPDPQMKKCSKRLISTRFVGMYSKILKDGGIVHLKTDSPFLYKYTELMTEHNKLQVLRKTDDIYGTCPDDEILSIKTNYEQQWLQRGLTIKYIAFKPEFKETYIEPQEEIEFDSYRSYNRFRRTANQ